MPPWWLEEAGAFAEADSEFDQCLKRRGELLELFTDDMPTYSYLPPVYYYQGRVRENLKSLKGSAEETVLVQLEDNVLPDDIVVVPEYQNVYVSGQVRTPGGTHTKKALAY